MVWPGDEEDEQKSRRHWRNSKYWSEVCKDIGKYLLTGGVAAPFLCIGGAGLSLVLLAAALLAGCAVLYVGYKLDPAEGDHRDRNARGRSRRCPIMDPVADILIRAGAVVVFGVVFLTFVYMVTQRAPR